MLKETNDQRLAEAGLKPEHVLFYQAWKELTGAKTFDRYQYPSVNTLNGISELIHDITAYLEGTSYTAHSLEAVQEELLGLLRRDAVLAESFPSIRGQLLQSLGRRQESAGQLKGLRYQLEYCRGVLERAYDGALIRRLAQAAADGRGAEQYSLTAGFISRCVDLGWSVKALSGRADTLKSAENQDLQSFLSRIVGARVRPYAVFLPFRLKITPREGNTKEEARAAVIRQLDSFGIAVKSREEAAEEFPGIDASQLRGSQPFLAVRAQAHDVFSAAHFAVVTLSGVLNILSFFTTIDSWTVGGLTFTAYDLESPYTKSLKASDIYRTYEYLDSSSRVYRRTAQFISRNGPRCPLSQKLLSSFSYANLSRSSMALEEKYMNIWIALESLCRTDACENIIGSILTLVPDAICLRYAYRLVRNFVEDCVRCEVSFALSTEVLDPRADDKELLVRETIGLFRDPALSAELEQSCQCSSLLRQRYGEMHAFLTDPRAFAAGIREYHAAAVRHLNRLYRVRNEIAHAGSLQEISTIRFTEHLYDYLATLVSEIMRFSEAKGLASPGEIFAVVSGNYAEFLDRSSAKNPADPKLLLGTLWDTGIMDYL